MSTATMPVTNTGLLKLTSSGDQEIVLTRVFDAPRSSIFTALTTPELISRWMLGPPGWTMPVCEVDLKVGGTYRFRWRRDAGAETGGSEGCGSEMMLSDMGVSGTYHELAYPDRIVHTETFDPDWYPGEAVITTTLTERDGKTMLMATILYESRKARDMVLASPMEQGVAMSYDRLEALLKSAG